MIGIYLSTVIKVSETSYHFWNFENILFHSFLVLFDLNFDEELGMSRHPQSLLMAIQEVSEFEHHYLGNFDQISPLQG